MRIQLALALICLCTVVRAEQPESPIDYSAGPFNFREIRSSSADEADQLIVRSDSGVAINLRFNRSRGISDIVGLTAKNNLRLAGGRMMRSDGRLTYSPRGRWILNEDTTVEGSRLKITLRSHGQKCLVRAPMGFRFEQLVPEQLPRSIGASDELAVAILQSEQRQGQRQNLRTVRIDMKTCHVDTGPNFDSPGFDFRLQLQAGRALIVALSESSLLRSDDGLSWRGEELPTAVHMLLAAELTSAELRIAASRADKDFQLGYFSKPISGGADWTERGSVELGSQSTWIEGAREAVVQSTADR